MGPALSNFFALRESWGTEGGRCKGLAVDDYGGTPGALALKPPGYFNIGVNKEDWNGQSRWIYWP